MVPAPNPDRCDHGALERPRVTNGVAMTQDELRKVSVQVEHAVDALLVAASTVGNLPAPFRRDVCETLVTVARLAGLIEALAEEFVILVPE